MKNIKFINYIYYIKRFLATKKKKKKIKICINIYKDKIQYKNLC